jgi:hypothetical protein
VRRIDRYLPPAPGRSDQAWRFVPPVGPPVPTKAVESALLRRIDRWNAQRAARSAARSNTRAWQRSPAGLALAADLRASHVRARQHRKQHHPWSHENRPYNPNLDPAYENPALGNGRIWRFCKALMRAGDRGLGSTPANVDSRMNDPMWTLYDIHTGEIVSNPRRRGTDSDGSGMM